MKIASIEAILNNTTERAKANAESENGRNEGRRMRVLNMGHRSVGPLSTVLDPQRMHGIPERELHHGLYHGALICQAKPSSY